jgi:tripartite motif-containing protein 71
VADGTGLANDRIQKFDSNGNFITTLVSSGSEDGQIKWPLGLAFDPKTDNLYVAEYGNDRIQKFDSNGKFITKWGSHGNSDGQFYGPAGITVDSSSNVYVVDSFNNRIQKFDSNGNFITKWGSLGSSNGQFDHPNGVAVDPKTGNVYIADFDKNSRIQVFAPAAKARLSSLPSASQVFTNTYDFYSSGSRPYPIKCNITS